MGTLAHDHCAFLVIPNQVTNRRNVNVVKDLKAQLKREAAKFDQAEVGV